jgi:hypothetical protein
MEDKPKPHGPETERGGAEKAPPPFEPDAELVTYLERGSKDDAPGKFRKAPKKLLGEN